MVDKAQNHFCKNPLQFLVLIIIIVILVPIDSTPVESLIKSKSSNSGSSPDGGDNVDYIFSKNWKQNDWGWIFGSSPDSDSTFILLPKPVINAGGDSTTIISSKDFPKMSPKDFDRIKKEYEKHSIFSKTHGNGTGHGQDNNIFLFCLMFLFGLIICGLIWCLCTVSKHHLDRDQGTTSESRRISSRSRRSNSNRGASSRRNDAQDILPNTTDLPPSYEDIVSDYEKLGAHCVLPSYKEIMAQQQNSSSSLVVATIPSATAVSVQIQKANSSTEAATNS